MNAGDHGEGFAKPLPLAQSRLNRIGCFGLQSRVGGERSARSVPNLCLKMSVVAI